MYLFYSENIDESKGNLEGEELHHCINVLRKGVGDTIHITDGNGGIYEANITYTKKSILEFVIVNKIFHQKPNIANTIALCPPKSSDRLEFFIEKAIETGIAEIVLFEAKRSERSRVNIDRMMKIAISAMKQSKQAYLPTIRLLKNLEAVIETSKNIEQRFIAHCDGTESILLDIIQAGTNKIILIGPEGDFTKEEVALAKSQGFLSVSLGKNILRTETAGIYASVLFSL